MLDSKYLIFYCPTSPKKQNNFPRVSVSSPSIIANDSVEMELVA